MSHEGNDYILDQIRDELEEDPIKRVLEQCRAEEARFQEEHDGMSSAEFYFESGFSDAQDEAMREREETQ
jgi:AraC-like DNA-binding protein